jgi:F-type H+-transporting ATPase subunit b
MPQIDQAASIYFSQLVWLLLIFAIIYFVIGRGMVAKIQGTVQHRDDKIAGDLAAAEQARDEAATVRDRYTAEMDAAHKAAHDAVQKAKDEATRDAEVKLKAAQAATAETVAKAELALADARANALADIEGVAADAARDIVARLSGVEVSEGEAMSAVRAQMAA